MRRIALVAMMSVGMASLAVADELQVGLASLKVITNDRGEARVLFRVDERIAIDDAIISRAVLSLPLSGAIEPRRIESRVYAISRDWAPRAVSWTDGWTRPGGDVHDRLYANGTIDLQRSGSSLVYDVSSILKESLENGVSSFGFLLTIRPADGEGFRGEDVARFANVGQGTLTLQYRQIPSTRRDQARGSRG